MSTIAVLKYDKRKLSRLRDSLKKGSSEDVFRLISTSSFQERALDYIRSITPVGKRLARSRERTGSSSDSLETTHLRDLWRIRRETSGGKISFVISNLLESKGGERGRRRFRSVEFGSKSMSFKAKKNFGFYSFERKKVSFVRKGMMVRRPERAGKRLMDATEDYIQNNMVPQIASAAKTRLQKRIANIR